MNPEHEWPEDAEGLRLVRAFLLLPPEKRRLVLELVEEFVRAQESCEEGTEVSPS